MKKNKIAGIILMFLVVLWMGFIFYMSAQSGEKSSMSSGKIATKIFEILYGDFTFESINAKEIAYSKVSYMVRKLAHMFEYFVLEILVFSAIKMLIKNRSITPIVSCSLSYLYAIFDEVHQSFVDGRGPAFFDTVIDFYGILLALIIMILMCVLFNRIEENKRSIRK